MENDYRTVANLMEPTIHLFRMITRTIGDGGELKTVINHSD